jgi:CRISPR-associated protein Cas2
MCAHAAPLEYSVFILVGTARAKDQCLQRLSALIDTNTDDVRCYPLPMRGFQERIGRTSLPTGIHWTGMPATLG